MCGLFGIIGPGIICDDTEALQDLAVFNLRRGVDGAGFYIGNSLGKRFSVHKSPETMLDLLFAINGIKNHPIHILSNNVFLGHTRAATRGEPKYSNSHPFDFQHIVGMHNGVFDQDRYAKSNSYETDSEAFFADLDSRGFLAVADELTAKDALAIVWYDKIEGAVKMYTNARRSISLAVHKTRGVIYYASEMVMLECALKRNNIEADYYRLHPFHLLTIYPENISPRKEASKYWRLTKILPGYAKKALEEKRTKEEKPKVIITPGSEPPEVKAEEQRKERAERREKAKIKLEDLPDFIKRHGYH